MLKAPYLMAMGVLQDVFGCGEVKVPAPGTCPSCRNVYGSMCSVFTFFFHRSMRKVHCTQANRPLDGKL